MTPYTDETLVEVCDACLRASCWHYVFLCDDYQHAGTVQKSVRELKSLGAEHPSHFSAERLNEVCGTDYEDKP